MLEHINVQLSSSNTQAYISVSDTGHRTLAFSLKSPGYGDVAIENYAGPATGTSNALLNIDVETGLPYSSTAGVNGVSGAGVVNNNYPSEQIIITMPAEKSGLAPTINTIFSQMHASARELASQISNVPGVSANAFSYAEVTSANFSNTAPSQLSLNGYDLIEYTLGFGGSDPAVLQSIPDPQVDPSAFNQYLADRINSHAGFKAQGIYAVSGQDAVSGEFELRVYSSEGDDLNFSFESSPGSSVAISDGEHSPLRLEGSGNSVRSQIVVGGRLDVQLDEGLVLSSRPSSSLLFGDTQAANFAQSTYLGITANITGTPDTGDRFTLDFNTDAQSDNRNGLAMINIQQAQIMDGDTSRISDAYGTLVEKAGIQANTAKINADAAKAVLDQTTSLRDSVSGVNLDEEAANLIKYEQFFQANAQVISVARKLFDTLIGAF